MREKIGGVAQVVERLLCTHEVLSKQTENKPRKITSFSGIIQKLEPSALLLEI
jgi:hypothetical protein